MQSNVLLAPYTSLGVGGPAEQLAYCESSESLQVTLASASGQQIWALGYGANVLISDTGLPGTTILVRTSSIAHDDNMLVADAGVWWDDLVQFAIRENLWGIELMSAIPGGVSAAVVGNIAAYGQAMADTLAWVEVFDRDSGQTRQIQSSDLQFGYRNSAFQTDAYKGLVILRAAFALQHQPTKELEYQTALEIAQSKHYDIHTLAGRRQTIIDTREIAGSLWDYRSAGTQMHTAGSFFRNPMVSDEAVEKLMAYEENGRTADMLRKMNQLHGGAQKRVSAAHVLLAAGFQRGQAWGPVRLHPDHILKIENTGGASAGQIYYVAQEIVRTVKEKLDIDLVPEVRLLGKFEENN